MVVLDETVTVGYSGHSTDHQEIAKIINSIGYDVKADCTLSGGYYVIGSELQDYITNTDEPIIYFRAGDYLLEYSLDFSDKKDFKVYGVSKHMVHILCKVPNLPAFDMRGTRFFTVEGICLEGDDTDTPDVAFSFARTASSLNCGNCEFIGVKVRGKWNKACWYSVAAEVIYLRDCISDNSLLVPYFYYADGVNSLNVSGYTPIDLTYIGTTNQRIEHSHIMFDPNSDGCSVFLGRNCSNSTIKDGYCQSRGNLPAFWIHASGSGTNTLAFENLHVEGDGATLFKCTGNQQITNLRMNNIQHGTGTTLITSSGPSFRGLFIEGCNSGKITISGSVTLAYIKAWSSYNTLDIDITDLSWSEIAIGTGDINGNLDTVLIHRYGTGGNKGLFLDDVQIA